MRHHVGVRAHAWPTILIATTNAGKLREIVRALDGLAVRLLTLADVPPVPEPAETGATFGENALIKARAYAYATGLPTVAEDSGLAIDALDGRPGVHSARYPGATYAEKFERLFEELTPHAEPWSAQFVCALAFVDPASPATATGGATFTCEEVVRGEITRPPRGSNGFGYDPIFFYPPYDATLAEVDTERKLAASHRGAAFRQFRQWLSR
jgi:XTP/dITP diphosphohydrolase